MRTGCTASGGNIEGMRLASLRTEWLQLWAGGRAGHGVRGCVQSVQHQLAHAGRQLALEAHLEVRATLGNTYKSCRSLPTSET